MEDNKRYAVACLKALIDHVINSVPLRQIDMAKLMQGTMELDRMLNDMEDDRK